MTHAELKAALSNRLTVPLWPHTGMALGTARNATYQAAARGEIPTIRIGCKIVVPTAALRKMLGIEPGDVAPKAA